MTNDALTPGQLADALDYFWNAAIGEAHNKQDNTGFAVISCIAEGLRAISMRLQELSASPAAANARSCTCHPSEAPQPCAEKYAFSECIAAAPTPPVQPASDEPVAWQWRSRIKGGAWYAWENGLYGAPIPTFLEIEERPLYTRPQPAKEVVEALAKAREALEIIAGKRQCVDNLMSNVDVANAALASLSQEQG